MAANTIVLNWQDNSGDETGFKIYKSTDGAIFNYLATVGTGVTTYEATVTNSLNYWFRVTTYNDAGESAYIQSGPLNCLWGGGGTGHCSDPKSDGWYRYLFRKQRSSQEIL